jgi:glycosyltransferase involved in cell wall biosynthesis
VIQTGLPVKNADFVKSSGSGSLYSIAFVDTKELIRVLKKQEPDLIIIEGWQTAIGTETIKVGAINKIPILMVSHGLSINPFKNTIIEIARAVGWLPYKFITLPYLIKRISIITTLNEQSQNYRFNDRNLAIKLGKKIMPLVNTAININEKIIPLSQREKQILLVGYFSRIKNQLDAIEVLNLLPEDISMKFIGKCEGKYFEECKRKVLKYKLEHRVSFENDWETNIAVEIAKSQILMITSITEVLPLTILEASASGTPVISTPVGCIPDLNIGIIAENPIKMSKAVLKIINNKKIWEDLSTNGLNMYNKKYNKNIVKNQLFEAVNYTVEIFEKLNTKY